jgi:phage antirepressor YoqD-like protein
MNSEITIFNQQEVLGKQFKVYGDADNPLFLAKDVAEWIEHSNPSMMLHSIDDDEKVLSNVYTPGGLQEMWFLTEDGLYEVLMQSRKPIAKEFKREVKRILKSIRRDGMFVTDKLLGNPEFAIKTFERLRDERNARIAAEAQVAELAPKAEFYDTVADSSTLLSMGDAAKLLNIKGIGRNTMFRILREHSILQWDNVPYQRYVTAGYFEIKERYVDQGYDVTVKKTTYVTQRGLDWLRKTLNGIVIAV